MFREYILISFLCFVNVLSDLPKLHMRHEYKMTFKSPMILPKDTNEIPFFEAGGHVIPAEKAVRLTTSMPNQQGWVWTKNASDFPGFQIDVQFKISGRGKIGADGIAIWIVEEKSLGGLALGGNPQFKGLGIFLDTYDNNGKGDSPIVLAAYNDGTKTYQNDQDGRNIAIEGAHCLKDFRNRPYPVTIRFRYLNGNLRVFLTSGLVNNEDSSKLTMSDLEQCFSVPLNLPRKPYYFGVSAATGSLGDDHDVMKFQVHSFVNFEEIDEKAEKRREEEQKKYEEEYQKNLDDIKIKEEDESKAGKSESDQYSGKSKLSREQTEINQNLIVIWKEMANQNSGMKNVLKTLNELHNNQFGQFADKFENIRLELTQLRNKVDAIGSNKDSGSNSFQNEKHFGDMHSSLDNLKSEIIRISNQINQLEEDRKSSKSQNSCSDCISFFLFLFISIIQTGAIIGFYFYQKNRESAAKKFY